MNNISVATVEVQGIGNIRTTRIGEVVLVSLQDVLEAFGRTTPAKVAVTRTPSMQCARISDGRSVIHMIDIAGAIISVASMRGMPQDRILAATFGLLELYADNSNAREGVGQPRAIPNLLARNGRPPRVGVTVPELIKAMKLRGAVHAGSAAQYVSDQYVGPRDRNERGVVFMDEAQAQRLLDKYVRDGGRRGKK